ncbi:hypothetical protein EMIT0194MI4_150064 [Pseudomonas sp. IT-194MI4]
MKRLGGWRTSTAPKLYPWTLGLYLWWTSQKRESRAMRGFLVWWAHTDLNRGPKDYESSALTN